jgi:hypothetical protein
MLYVVESSHIQRLSGTEVRVLVFVLIDYQWLIGPKFGFLSLLYYLT